MCLKNVFYFLIAAVLKILQFAEAEVVEIY